jgi:hypothetical protein
MELCRITSDGATSTTRVIAGDKSWIYGYDPEKKQRIPPNGKSRACSSLAFTSRGLLTKYSSRQAKQSILHTTVMFYGDCMNMNMNIVPHPPYLPDFASCDFPVFFI